MFYSFDKNYKLTMIFGFYEFRKLAIFFQKHNNLRYQKSTANLSLLFYNMIESFFVLKPL